MDSRFCCIQLSGHLLLLPQYALDIALSIALCGGVALVVLLFPLTKAKKQLGIAVADVNLQRHNGISLLLGQAEQLTNLCFMHQQLARPGRIGRIVPIPLLERTDMHIVYVNLTITNRSKGIADIHPGVTDRFDLRPRQHHARFIGILDKVVMGSLLILGQHLAVAIIFLRHVILLLPSAPSLETLVYLYKLNY